MTAKKMIGFSKPCPTKRALDGWDSAPFSDFSYTRIESCSRSFIHARPPASNASRWVAKNSGHVEYLETNGKEKQIQRRS